MLGCHRTRCGRCVPIRRAPMHTSKAHTRSARRVYACLGVNNRGAFETCALLYMQIRQLQPICTGRASGMGLDAGTMSIGGLIRLCCHTSSGFTLVSPPSTPSSMQSDKHGMTLCPAMHNTITRALRLEMDSCDKYAETKT